MYAVILSILQLFSATDTRFYSMCLHIIADSKPVVFLAVYKSSMNLELVKRRVKTVSTGKL